MHAHTHRYKHEQRKRNPPNPCNLQPSPGSCRRGCRWQRGWPCWSTQCWGSSLCSCPRRHSPKMFLWSCLLAHSNATKGLDSRVTDATCVQATKGLDSRVTDATCLQASVHKIIFRILSNTECFLWGVAGWGRIVQMNDTHSKGIENSIHIYPSVSVHSIQLMLLKVYRQSGRYGKVVRKRWVLSWALKDEKGEERWIFSGQWFPKNWSLVLKGLCTNSLQVETWNSQKCLRGRTKIWKVSVKTDSRRGNVPGRLSSKYRMKKLPV